MALSGTLQARVDRVRQRAPIEAVIGKVVKLGKGRKPRGQCPFHGSTSDSFAVDAEKGYARCWGCGWPQGGPGDVIRFVQDYYGLDFMGALTRLEDENGLDALEASPVHRDKAPVRRRARDDAPRVTSLEMGGWLWRRGSRRDLDPVRLYLAARGVPSTLLEGPAGRSRLADVRFMAAAPIVPWIKGQAPDVPTAPAMLCLIREAPRGAQLGAWWRPIGVHVTWLAPDFSDKMKRTRRDGTFYPARKMLGGSLGGAVALPALRRGAAEIVSNAPLFVGEGLETVLSGLAMLGAGPDAAGLAVLSLGSLQGGACLIKGALPLYDLQPDPTRPGVAFGHDGQVTILVDADMKPLRGPIDRTTGAHVGEAVIDAPRAPIVRRAISQAERAQICATLATRMWRAAGCPTVKPVRPHFGQDFNDAVRETRS